MRDYSCTVPILDVLGPDWRREAEIKCAKDFNCSIEYVGCSTVLLTAREQKVIDPAPQWTIAALVPRPLKACGKSVDTNSRTDAGHDIEKVCGD